MAAVKKIPMRQCVGCGERKSKKELIRIVCSPSEDPERVTIGFDLTGKKMDEVHIYAVVWPVLSWPERKKLLNEL